MSTWLYFQMLEYDRTIPEAVDFLNASLGTSYRVDRVKEWKRPSTKVRPPRPVQLWLLRQVILPLLKITGFRGPVLTGDQFELLCSRLMPLPRPDEEHIESAKRRRAMVMHKGKGPKA